MEFQVKMRWRNDIACDDENIDILNDNMIAAIVDTASELNMVWVMREGTGIRRRNKPWFDRECQNLRKGVDTALR